MFTTDSDTARVHLLKDGNEYDNSTESIDTGTGSGMNVTFEKTDIDISITKNTKDSITVREYLISNPDWNHILWVTGAFHYPLFDIYVSPGATVIQIVACLGFLVAVLGCGYDLYSHCIAYISTDGIAYIIGDIVVLLQNASVVMGIYYAMNRMNDPFGDNGSGSGSTGTTSSGRVGSRSLAGEASCFDYALNKSRIFVLVAVLMFSFTAAVIIYNGSQWYCRWL